MIKVSNHMINYLQKKKNMKKKKEIYKFKFMKKKKNIMNYEKKKINLIKNWRCGIINASKCQGRLRIQMKK